MNKSFQIYLFRLGMKIATFLPRRLTVNIAKGFALIGFLIARKEKVVLKKNLIQCRKSPSLSNVLKIMTNYAICLSDFLRIPILNNETLKQAVTFKGQENLSYALAQNRGAILITGHIGNWDLAGVFVASIGFPLTAIVEEIPGHSDFFNFLRTRTGMETVFTKERAKMIAALNQNRVLVFLADRPVTGKGIRVKFLNGEKLIPKGAATFALKYNTPICFGYFVLNENKNNKKIYKAEISEPIYPENQTPEGLTQIIADRLSEYIREFPLQWFVFQDEWLNPAPTHKGAKSGTKYNSDVTGNFGA